MNSPGSEARHGILSSLASPTSIVVMTFILSRFAYYYLGIRFDSTDLFYAWQFLDVDLLRERLIESLFYLHSQPPLFNLFLGMVLKAAPNHLETAFHLVYLGFGLTMAISLVAVMIRLGVPSIVSTTLTVIFVVSPAAVLYENWLFYTYPVASMLSVSALFLHKWLSEHKSRYGLIFFTGLSCLVLTRNMFQLVWVAFACGVILIYGRIRIQSLAAIAAVPLILVVGWHVKNWHYFGVFNTSSWTGMNLARSQARLLSVEETLALVERGKLSKLALAPAFSDFDAYGEDVPHPLETNIPALDKKVKNDPYGLSISIPNYNYIGYLDISKANLADTLYIIKSKPYKFAWNVLDAFWVYIVPASDYLFLGQNRQRISFLVTKYNALLCGSLKEGQIGLLIALSLGLSIGYGFYLAVRWLKEKPGDVAYAATVMFVWLTIIYLTIVVNLFEREENNRIRFTIEPYVVIMLGIMIDKFRRILFKS